MNEIAVTSVPAQPDYIALAIVVVLAAIVVGMVIRKHSENKKKEQQANAVNVTITAVAESSAPTNTAESGSSAEAPGSAGKLKIHDVEPKTVAMLMAIVADEMGKPLNELRFISIKEVK